MKRIVRGVCGLLSAVMLLSTTAMAADYTPVVTSDERVKGFYNVYTVRMRLCRWSWLDATTPAQ